MRHTFSGEGPGAQTPDGCSVSLYRDLPYMGELEEVIDQFQPGMSVLELGCGTGRLCSRLVEGGCSVTGVDESSEMLTCLPPQVHAVQSQVETLNLRRTYDVVLLASHLINHPDMDVREAFVRGARRHLQPGGLLVLKRHNVEWLASAQVGLAGQAHGSAVFVEAVTREPGLVHMTLRYELGGQSWRHSFATTPLSEADVETLLHRCAFRAVQWQGKQNLWAVAEAGSA